MTADEILQHVLSELQTDKAGLAQMIDVHKSTISNISLGYTKKISSKIAQRIVAIRPDINYNFIIGKSDIIKVSGASTMETDLVFLDTSSESKIPMEEMAVIMLNNIAVFMLNNIETFEENEIFKVYRSSLINQAKVELLQEQILLKNKMDQEKS